MVNVAEKIKKALFDKGWTQRKLCSEIEMTENGYKKMVENHSWKLDTIEKIATVLELPITYFITGSEQKFDTPLTLTESKPQTVTESNFGSEVLARIVEEMSSLRNQLSIKDKQIDGLQRTVDALLSNPTQARQASFNKPVSTTGKIMPLNSRESREEKKKVA